MKSVTTLDTSFLVPLAFLSGLSKPKVRSVFNRRYYSTSNSDSNSCDLPLPILTFNDLNNKNCIKSCRELLKGKGGIYSFKNIVSGKQYIGSAKDFYLRFSEQPLHNPLHPKAGY